MSAYDTLVAKLGEEGARAEMVRRAKLKKDFSKGGGFRNPKIAREAQKRGLETRLKNKLRYTL